MSAIKDGGPAFPISAENEITPNGAGMSMRDYFAAKALNACIKQAHRDSAHMAGEDWRIGIALDTYKWADAMLRAREVKA